MRLLFLKKLYFIAVLLMTSTVEEKSLKHDELFEKLNNYHPRIKLTIEIRRQYFLSLHLNNGIYDFKF